MKPLLLQHLSGESIGRFPVWAMRQAGRYLAGYREIRAKHSFWEMVQHPELAVEVSLTPFTAPLPVNGIILFSDILTMPHGLGLPIEMREGVGPYITKPLRTVDDFAVFESYDPSKHTPYVSQALTQLRQKVDPNVALLGFAGAPWTVATYLLEPGKKFQALHEWLHRDPQSLTSALEKLADATTSYLKSQIAAGADVVQVFDTWLGEMPRGFFRTYYLPVLNRVFDGVRASKAPLIFYSRHAHHLLADLADLHVDVISTDELLPLGEVDHALGGKFSLQGNLDPLILFNDPAVVRQQTRHLVEEARSLKKPAILNLGHGILPKTPVESVRAFFEEARQLWV